MIIDDNEIQDIIKQEIKQQVSNKIKSVGRETIKILYKEVMAEQIRNFILKQRIELANEIKKEINYDKDLWKKSVADNIANKLIDRINTSFDDHYDYIE